MRRSVRSSPPGCDAWRRFPISRRPFRRTGAHDTGRPPWALPDLERPQWPRISVGYVAGTRHCAGALESGRLLTRSTLNGRWRLTRADILTASWRVLEPNSARSSLFPQREARAVLVIQCLALFHQTREFVGRHGVSQAEH